MLIKNRRGWELPESAATPEAVFADRRRLLKGMAAGPALLSLGALAACGEEATADNTARQLAAAPADPSAHLYPAKGNPKFADAGRPLTDPMLATSYVNFYEFGSHKNVSRPAQALPLRPWTVTIDGDVEAPMTLGIDELLAKMPLEERVYRHRCVEAWSMVVPWSGFALAELVKLARPLSSAKYLRMETFTNKEVAPGQKQHWYPWPYVEGLTMAEATNELAFIATGIYGRPMPPQNGAPLRLAVPWKYGFKSVKSIVRFNFTAERPVSFWESLQAKEYGFWANVNPAVSHPRWSQADERPLGVDGRIPTVIFNGYGEYVAELYKGLEQERLFM